MCVYVCVCVSIFFFRYFYIVDYYKTLNSLPDSIQQVLVYLFYL